MSDGEEIDTFDIYPSYDMRINFIGYRSQSFRTVSLLNDKVDGEKKRKEIEC